MHIKYPSYFCGRPGLKVLSRTKKTVIVDVVIVTSEMWERGGRGKRQRVGQLLPDRGLEQMRICHHKQETGRPSKSGFFIIFTRGSIITTCTLCKYD